ncbi:MAG TPA: amidohydrolase family protein [Gammaproteobacteria bacterium]
MTRVGLVLLLALAAAAAPARAEQRIANVSQGTNMALALSPDGESLIVDLLGRLWRLPSSGGGATQLTPDGEGARLPRIGPLGRRVVYQRAIDGQWDLWLLDLETGERRALTHTPHDEREPDFMPDGRSVVFAANPDGRFCLWRIDIETGVLTQLTAEPGDASFPTVSEHGEIAYVREWAGTWSLRALLPSGAGIELFASDHRLTAPSWRPGGGVLLFNTQRRATADAPAASALEMLLLSPEPVLKTLTRTEDVFESRAAWSGPGEYLYTADGRIWRRRIAHVTRRPVPLFAAVGLEPASPPPFGTALDAAGPHRVLGVTGVDRSSDGRVAVFTALGDLWLVGRRSDLRRLTDDPFVEFDADVSPDGTFAVFASDRAGFVDLWRVTLPGGVLTQLTRRPEKAYRPAISPDGRRVAYLETTGFETLGEAALRVLDLDGGAVRTLAEGLIGPARPYWENEERLAVAVHSSPAAPRRDAILRVDVATGTVRTAPASEAPAERAAPASEAPAEGAAAADVDALPPLEWEPPAPSEPYVVRAGRLFDGIRSDYRRDVDIHIEGQRITAIVDHGALPLPARVVDARDAAIIPGLIDVHAHHAAVGGERLGRLWLAHGVTTVRELTDDVASAFERAESWASGRRLGPRLVVSPVGGLAPPVGAADSPIPVRPASRIEIAASLFSPSRAVAPFLAAEHASAAAPSLARTSPLGLYYDDVFSTLVASGTVVTTALGAAGGASAVPALVDDGDILRRLYSAEERATWRDRSGFDGRLDTLEETLARLVRSGGQVAAGTEAPVVPYGLGVHVELALLVEAGLPPDQALRIATASNALALGLGAQLGTLEAGKLADFVVVDGDPLADIGDALNVTAVVKGGAWLDRARLSGGE